MKLSVETCALSDRVGDFAAFDLIKRAGFDCVDYSFYAAAAKPLMGEDHLAHAQSLREQLDALGLTCNQAHAPFSFTHKNAFTVEDGEYLAIVRAVQAAAVLGAKCIVVHSVGLPAARQAEEWAYNQAFYKSLAPYARAAGIQIAVENLFSYDGETHSFTGRINTPQSLSRFIKELNDLVFTACVDVGHAALCGVEPWDFIGGMEEGLLTALHVQDGFYSADSHTLPYLGRFNWEKTTAALKLCGYQGDFTFEVFGYFACVPTELLFSALCFAEEVGRNLIAKMEG